MRSIICYMKNPLKIVKDLGEKGLLNWIPDKPYLKLVYRSEIGKKLNLNNPITFTEKLQWLKLNDRKPEYSTYVDKYAVRQYIKETIGEDYLIPIIGVYTSVEEIDWNLLPDKFVLKCTHGSNANIICYNKDKLDIMTAKKKLKKWIKKNWYWYGREWPYKNVKPGIICEKFMSDTNKPPDDYKFLCFNGKVKLIEIHMNRFGNHTQDFYDMRWNKPAISQDGTASDIMHGKPGQFEKMVELSEQLAADKRHVRIDWYIVGGKLYFGEITFYDASGFDPFDNEDDDYLLGSWINLKGE